MSSSDAMFEASSVYFQYVNEQAARVKILLNILFYIDCFSSWRSRFESSSVVIVES